ncbi:hypothetical protein KY285_035453 [Solanum tuberosum]|nr:hypothetical protein KY285_035453 [Solanum tuberosum]
MLLTLINQNAILASFDPTLAPTVVVAISTKVVWDALHTAYANKSQTRIFILRDRLARLTKDTRPVTDYLHQIRSLCDELATAGAPVSNPKLIVKILSGLGSKFREFSVSIRARDSTISYEEIYEKLMDHKFFLKYEDDKKPLLTNITAAVAQKTSSTPPHQGTIITPAVAVQVRTFLPTISNDRHNHGAHKETTSSSPLTRIFVANNVIVGATHHIASDAQSLDIVHDYHDTEEITMGNGHTIPIYHTGSEYGGVSSLWAE